MVACTTFHDDDRTFRERYALVIAAALLAGLAATAIVTAFGSLGHLLSAGL